MLARRAIIFCSQRGHAEIAAVVDFIEGVVNPIRSLFFLLNLETTLCLRHLILADGAVKIEKLLFWVGCAI